MTEHRTMPHSAAIEDVIVNAMRADLTRPKWWATMWGRVTIIGSLVGFAGLAIAGVVILDRAPVTQELVVHCFATPAINPDGTYQGTAVAISSGTGSMRIDDAIRVCSDVWASGAMSTDKDPLSATDASAEVPASLTTCVMADGSAAVIPGSVTCSSLKLHPTVNGGF